MSENLPRIGSALLVRDEANKILLGLRNKDPQRGCWVIPGGKIHAFESIAQAAAREIEEETGLKVNVGDQFGVYEIINPPHEHRIVIYSWGTVVEGAPKASDDLSEVRFFSIEELGDTPMTPLVRRVMADAGLLTGEGKAVPRNHVQLNLFLLPVLLAGARDSRSASGRQPRQHQRRRKRVLSNSPLLFDMHASV